MARDWKKSTQHNSLYDHRYSHSGVSKVDLACDLEFELCSASIPSSLMQMRHSLRRNFDGNDIDINCVIICFLTSFYECATSYLIMLLYDG